MKVTVGLDGEVSFETEDVPLAVAMVKALRNGAAPAKPTPTAKPRGPYKKKAVPPVTSEPLSPQVVSTWEWLVAHDDIAGVRVTAIADGLGISNHAATFRLNRLIEKGLAHRLKRGRYRPGELPAELPHDLSQEAAPASQEAAEPPE